MINSSIYKYYPANENEISCLVCGYRYPKNAPLSTLQKHLRVKHRFSIRNPLTPQELHNAIMQHKSRSSRSNIFSLLNPESPKNCKNHSKEHATSISSQEMALVEWIISENIDLNLILTDSFKKLFSFTNETFPSEQRIKYLISLQNQNEKPPCSTNWSPNQQYFADQSHVYSGLNRLPQTQSLSPDQDKSYKSIDPNLSQSHFGSNLINDHTYSF